MKQPKTRDHIPEIVYAVLKERLRAIKKHGDGSQRPDGITGFLIPAMESIRDLVDIKTQSGDETWAQVLAEEFLEAVTETDQAKLEVELIQVASTAINWIAALRRRKHP